MRRDPRDPRIGIFTRPVILLMTIGGVWLAIVNLLLFIWAYNSGRSADEARTMAFVSVVLFEFFKAYNFRSDRKSVFHKPFANKWLNLAILWELVLLGVIVYLPALHSVFGTFSLPLVDWAIIVVLAATIIPVLEIAKWMVRRGWFGRVI
jgi:Ca2+-transporting ATPase